MHDTSYTCQRCKESFQYGVVKWIVRENKTKYELLMQEWKQKKKKKRNNRLNRCFWCIYYRCYENNTFRELILITPQRYHYYYYYYGHSLFFVIKYEFKYVSIPLILQASLICAKKKKIPLGIAHSLQIYLVWFE